MTIVGATLVRAETVVSPSVTERDKSTTLGQSEVTGLKMEDSSLFTQTMPIERMKERVNGRRLRDATSSAIPVDSQELNRSAVGIGSRLDLNQAMRRVVPGTELLVADAASFASQLSGFSTEVATSAINSDAFSSSFLRFDEQYGFPAPGGGTGAMGQTFQAMLPPEAQGLLLVIPSITVAERYDSNVFNAPKIPGLTREDYATSVYPRLLVQQQGRRINGTFQVGGIGERYINNPGLSYFGVNTGLSLDVSQLLQAIPLLRALRLSENFTFTPQQPAFLAGDTQLSQAVNPDVAPSIADQYNRGLQAFRVNTYANASGINGSYAGSPTTTVQAAYTYSFIRFGAPFVPGSRGNFFPSTSHTFYGGPQIQVSARDTLNLNASYQRTVFTQNSYSTQVGTLGWARLWTPQVRSNVAAGAQVTQLENVGAGSTSGSNQVTFNGNASLSWTRGNMTILSLNYSVGVYPSYFVAAVPLISHVITTSVWHRLSPSLSVSGGVNYGHNGPLSESSSTTNLTFQSVGTNLGFSYLIMPTLSASILHTFGYVKGPVAGGISSTASGLGNEFTRNAVTFSITKFGIF